MGPLKTFALGFLVVLALAVPLFAQNPHGTLFVAAEDSSGGRIAGAGITLTLEKSAIIRTARTDAHGEARFDALPPGTYIVTVSAAGFAEQTTRVSVTVSSQ